MNIELVKLKEEHQPLLVEMIEEWKADIEQNHTNGSPSAIFRNDPRDFAVYLDNLEIKKDERTDRIPDSTFFCLDRDRNIFVGAVNIRHYLNDVLLLKGGHIGDGIRPSERRKGYATAMIGLALEECKRIGIRRVLMICNKDNSGSAKSIQKNGGVLENEVVYPDGTVDQRYWIELED
ncbi:GNAT family N-acetyltransferase [Facklamia miroungae]|uniref:Predicted acetyltransferase n=1 Tax=Facklamia miroungae TaxID=120956 RepID=A0A1G7QG32_9LACT|nr:GNAT family N-acetyltransferase [Facklamia miroungae]NKZ28928.1 GNAT family N-acetyltransferase [Facklamia miroungae]SDF97456.1 Predicted acetyltransferase [Facklamia miroungae]